MHLDPDPQSRKGLNLGSTIPHTGKAWIRISIPEKAWFRLFAFRIGLHPDLEYIGKA
jgi:hypothetical protein